VQYEVGIAQGMDIRRELKGICPRILDIIILLNVLIILVFNNELIYEAVQIALKILKLY